MTISMEKLAEIVLQRNIEIETIFDVGCYNGKDGQTLAKLLKVKADNVFGIEAHPEMIDEAKKRIKNVYEAAISDQNKKKVKFNCVDLKEKQNHGVSSLLERLDSKNKVFNEVEVETKRLDKLSKDEDWPRIDLIKIDTEGHCYEGLVSLGELLKDIKVIHVEGEVKEIWKGQKLYTDIKAFLKRSGFVCVSIAKYNSQLDTVWVRTNLKVEVEKQFKKEEKISAEKVRDEVREEVLNKIKNKEK